jgi:hypothetical protein
VEYLKCSHPTGRSKWTFRDAVRGDCIDPEGNVVQLVQQVS